jgi:DNA polymerase-3 subunit alpha
MIGMSLEELYALPFDDPEVIQGFKDNKVVGLFQFDGRAMRSVNREVKPDNFAEICDINALARPGPLHSGATAEYIMAKHGKKKVENLHPVVTRITKHTQGQIVYQEQILQVVRELGDFSWEEAARIRKIISKKQGEQEFNRQMDKFLKGAKKNGVQEVKARKIWKQLVTAGAYAFNAAHCVSYGMLGYWTMWLKIHYPYEYYCASLQKYDPKTKGFDLLKEALEQGVDILPPHPRHSQETWAREFDEDGMFLGLRAGLTQITGIGEKVAPRLLEFREAFLRLNEDIEWSDYEAVSGIGPKTIEKFEDFSNDPDPFGVYRLGKALKMVRRYLWHEGEADGIPFPSSQSSDVPYENVRGNHVWAGFVKDRNLKDIYELHRSRTGDELDPNTVKQPEYVNYVVLTGEDETGPLNITIHRYNGLYEKFKDLIWNMDIKRDVLVVDGYKRNEYRRAIYATNVWVINPEKLKGR